MVIIESAQAKWASRSAFVLKIDSTLPVWVAYLKLNKVTVQDSYPTLRMEKSTDSLRYLRYLQHCIKKWILANLDFPWRSKPYSVHVFLRYFSLHINIFWIGKRSLNVFTSDGRLTYESQGQFTLVCFANIVNIFENARQEYRPCLKGSGVITQPQSEIEPEVSEFPPKHIEKSTMWKREECTKIVWNKCLEE